MKALFPLNGMGESQPVMEVDYGFRYDPMSQVHVIDTPAGPQPVVDVLQGIHALAQTTLDTWFRDPSNYNYNIKDDSHATND